MAHDVFISFSVEDKSVGDAVCATLETRNIRCWIAPRDIVPGSDWGEAIIHGIKGARLMVLVFSSHANGSAQVKREVEVAINSGLVIIPFRIENILPKGSLEYFLSTPHWLDAITPPLEVHLIRLADAAEGFLKGSPFPLPKASIALSGQTTGSRTKGPTSKATHLPLGDGVDRSSNRAAPKRRFRPVRRRLLAVGMMFVILIGAGIVAETSSSSGSISSTSSSNDFRLFRSVPLNITSVPSDRSLLSVTDLGRTRWAFSPLPNYDELLGRFWYGGPTPLPSTSTTASLEIDPQRCASTLGTEQFIAPEMSSFASYAPADVIPSADGWLALSEQINYFTSPDQAETSLTYLEQKAGCTLQLPPGLSSANTCPEPGVNALVPNCRTKADWYGPLSEFSSDPDDSISDFTGPTGAAGPDGKFYASYFQYGSAVAELDVLAGTSSGFGTTELLPIATAAYQQLESTKGQLDAVAPGPPTTTQINEVNNIVLSLPGWKNNGLGQTWLNDSPQPDSEPHLTPCDLANLGVIRIYEEGDMATYSSSGQIVMASDPSSAMSTNTAYFTNAANAAIAFRSYNEYRGICPFNIVEFWNPNPHLSYEQSDVSHLEVTLSKSGDDGCEFTINNLSFDASRKLDGGVHLPASSKVFWLIGIAQCGNVLVQTIESKDQTQPNSAHFSHLLAQQIAAMEQAQIPVGSAAGSHGGL